VHLGVGACLLGTAGIRIGDFVSLSPRVTVFSTNDDFRGGHMTGPTVPSAHRSVQAEEVVVEANVVIGCGAVVLPGVRLGWGASIGALSLVKHDISDGDVVAGAPARVIGQRDLQRLRDLERRLRTGDGPA
jgi:galactoside O-acetyltransferase